MQQHPGTVTSQDKMPLKETSDKLTKIIGDECAEFIKYGNERLRDYSNFPALQVVSPANYVSQLAKLTAFHAELTKMSCSNYVYFSPKEVPKTFDYWTGNKFENIDRDKYVSSILQPAFDQMIKDTTLAKTTAENILKTEINQ